MSESEKNELLDAIKRYAIHKLKKRAISGNMIPYAGYLWKEKNCTPTPVFGRKTIFKSVCAIPIALMDTSFPAYPMMRILCPK